MSPQKKVGILLITGLALFSTFYYATWQSYQTGFEEGRRNVTCEVSPATRTIRIGDCVCPMPNICPPEKTCPECQTCPTTTTPEDTTTTTTTIPKIIVPSDVEKKVLNYCKEKQASTAPAIQHGCFLAQRGIADILELPNRPRFFPGPSIANAEEFYNPIQGKTLGDEQNLTCFAKHYDEMGEYFILDRSPDENNHKQWSWDDAQCQGSSMRISHL